MILQYTGTIDEEHEARMKQIKKDHQNAMKSIQLQDKLESDKHKAIMTRIQQQSDKVEQSGIIDVAEFSGKVY